MRKWQPKWQPAGNLLATAMEPLWNHYRTTMEPPKIFTDFLDIAKLLIFK
jgi:hypothetical protein